MAGKRRPRRSATVREARRRSLTAFTPPEHDPLADSRLRPLVERYAALAGVGIEELGPQLVELLLPASEQEHFGGRERLLVAFTVSALELSPEAEMAVVGSPFIECLLGAVRRRGVRLALGAVPNAESSVTPLLGIDVDQGTATISKLAHARHAAGRLLARVVIRAGAALEEHLLESRFFDLVTGEALPADVATACVAVEQGVVLPNERGVPAKTKRAGRRPWPELLERMIADLQGKLAPRLEQLRAEAARHLSQELERIDRYYHRMLEDASSGRASAAPEDAFANAARAIETEHARRRLEEERRHQVRTIVHPLQMVEVELLVQHARWRLSTTAGHRATVKASRYGVQSASREWRLRCPTCAAEPAALLVPRDDEVGCPACMPSSPPRQSSTPSPSPH